MIDAYIQTDTVEEDDSFEELEDDISPDFDLMSESEDSSEEFSKEECRPGAHPDAEKYIVFSSCLLSLLMALQCEGYVVNGSGASGEMAHL